MIFSTVSAVVIARRNKSDEAIHHLPRRLDCFLLRFVRSRNDESAYYLTTFFGTSVKFWIGLQADYDVEEAEKSHDYGQVRSFQELNIAPCA